MWKAKGIVIDENVFILIRESLSIYVPSYFADDPCICLCESHSAALLYLICGCHRRYFTLIFLFELIATVDVCFINLMIKVLN